MSLENFARRHFVMQIINHKPERSEYKSSIGDYVDKVLMQKNSLVIDNKFLDELHSYLLLSDENYARQFGDPSDIPDTNIEETNSTKNEETNNNIDNVLDTQNKKNY